MRYLLLLAAIILRLAANSQTDTTQIPFVAYWASGDQYSFKVTKVKQQWKAENAVKTDSSQYVVKFEVIDSAADAYRIKWSYKNDLTNSFNIPSELLERFSKYELTEVIYTTTETGVFKEIENWQEISSIMTNLFKDITDVIGTNQTRSDLEKALQPLTAIYSSQQGIEQLVFKELQYFHFPFGISFSTVQPIEYEEQLPNMVGGDPIKGDVTIKVEKVDFQRRTCVLVQEMKLNPIDTRDAIMKFFKKAGLNDKEMKEALKNARLDITDNNRYDYRYHPGVPMKIMANRESIMDINGEKSRRLDRTVIELIN